MKLPTISTYGNYSSSNYGSNALRVDLGRLTLYFSYKTIIAFCDGMADDGLVIRENSWSTTTGKHLNWIDEDHKKRIASDEFEFMLAECLKKHNLTE